MRWNLLLLASLAFVSPGDGAPMKFMSAPNLLRVGTPENIFVECQECSGKNISVRISAWNYPTDTIELSFTSVVLDSAHNYQSFGQITLPPGSFSKNPKVRQYVYLKAEFDDRLLKTVVLVTFQSGYIFIQTDKPLYNPGSTVHYRMFALTPRMKPVESTAEGAIGTSITIDIETPDGIILPQKEKTLKSGIFSGKYELPDLVSPGIWKVVAKFETNPQQSYFSNFEVKEYVLPNMEVILTPLVPFFQVDSPTFNVTIKARYLFGEDVDGTAYVVFGIIRDEERKTLPSSLQRVPIQKGKGDVTLKRNHITETFKDVDELEGHNIFVSVSVLTDSGSEMVEAELTDIKIVKSPYSIKFIKTPYYFKPGMGFDFTVEVTNPDGSPAKGIPLRIDYHGMDGISDKDNGFVKLSITPNKADNSLLITAKTAVPNLSDERQSSAQFKAEAYKTNSSTYINIVVKSSKLDVGNNLNMNLNLNKESAQNKDITFLVLSKGQLVKFGRQKIESNSLVPLHIHLTKDMLPSFRVVVYYHTDDSEVVSDSVWLDVDNSCMGSVRNVGELTLEAEDPLPSYQPGKILKLKVTGDPGANVGLVAVEKGVYVLNNKFRLTQKKIWDEVEKYDTGCTPGGGNDSMGVFYDAGLVFQTSNVTGTPYRQDPKCEERKKPRSKRAVTIMEVATSLVSKYENNALQTECCLDGMKETPLSYSCDRRSKYILDGQACIEAFLDCCKQMQNMLDEQKKNSFQLARTEAKDKYMDSRKIDVRSNFKESWLWKDYILPTCTSKTKTCETTTLTRSVPLPDSITTWVFTGISLSKTNGICVSKSLEIIARKNFFIDLKLPYSAVRGEQLEIKAILHNYAPNSVKVRVELIDDTKVCSAASKRGKYRVEVIVGAETSRSVPFIIIPMATGKLDIVVKASVEESQISDGIQKPLRVVSEGVLVRESEVINLDPVNNGISGVQTVVFRNQIQKETLVPNSESSVQISVTGKEDVSEMVENAISGKSLGILIRKPGGCGEQNMARMTLPVIATRYLDATNQWEAVGLHRRDEAIQHITTGYTNQFVYRNKDGSYKVWKNQPKSSWLTTYVVKIFSLAYKLLKIEPQMICHSVRFLILNSKMPDGMFKEVGNVLHKEMIGDIAGLESDASLTAFSLIALQESREICSKLVPNLPSSINKSVEYLEKRLPSLTNPYAVALTSYALANNNRLNREVLFEFISPELTHWNVSRGHLYTLEATAYALLALVRAEAFADARPIVRWLSTQHSALGGYGSTQATVMVYQAVAEYWAKAKEQEEDYNLDVEILEEGKNKPFSYKFTKNNHFATRTSKINNMFHNITVTAKGTGEATVKMVSLYYALPIESKSDCQMFNMSVELIPEKENDDSVYKLRIKVLYMDKTRDSGMAILDIGLLTGYTADTNDLKALSKGCDRTIAHYEMNKLLSEKGSLIIYLDKVSHTLEDEISFRIHKSMDVGYQQPAAVSVYDYYNQTKCVKYYHPTREAGKLLLLGEGEARKCAEERCSMQKKNDISNSERIDKLCEVTQIEFAYKVRLEEFSYNKITDTSIMRIMDVIKRGNIDRNPRGKQRKFISYLYCREGLDLQKGKTYLIMGSSKDVEKTRSKEGHRYTFGERTWIEYWPTREECQTQANYRQTCLDLKTMMSINTDFDCDL